MLSHARSVSLEEFEAWWMKTQSESPSSVRKPVEYTYKALLAGLEAYQELLVRKELESLAQAVE